MNGNPDMMHFHYALTIDKKIRLHLFKAKALMTSDSKVLLNGRVR